MVLMIDALTRWSHVSLLSIYNTAFAKVFAQIIWLRARFMDHSTKKIRLNNTEEFTSQAFDDYCMSMGILVEQHVAHVHTQNWLAESLVKRLPISL